MSNENLKRATDTLDYLIIGHNATSYKLPLIVDSIKEYENKICIDCKNIKGKYIVFDKDTFFEAVDAFRNSQNQKETKWENT